MAYRFLLIIVTTVLIIQLCRGRYCQEAVNSVQIVESCPTSKTEWDAAARKKNCSRIALQQDCSPVEQFQYHCVINGYRNETLEVCAPARIIFGHCVEFNVPGGVIQDQLSTPCDDIFPKCGIIYNSKTAYKYPDCYQLVSKNKIVSITTTIESILNDGLNKKNHYDILTFLTLSVFWIVLSLSIFILLKVKKIYNDFLGRRSLFVRKMAFLVNNNMFNPELPTRNTSPAPSSIQSASSGSTIYEVASDASGDNSNVLQPKSDNLCDLEPPIRNISPASSSIQSASSGSTIFEDASEGRSDDPDDLQPNSDDTQKTHHL